MNIYSLEIQVRREKEIINANSKDCLQAENEKLSPSLIDRLKLDSDRIAKIAESVKNIAMQKQVVGCEISRAARHDGLIVLKESIPIGVIGMIFESRPNVVIDCASLAIKSGNAMVLKGGKEAYHSNLALSQVVDEAIKGILPEHTIQLLDSKDRSLVKELISRKGDIDLLIPRGGESLIHYVWENAKVPVIAHYKGLCHLYVDEFAQLEKALKICVNSKLQRPGVCNALETLLVHKRIADEFLSMLLPVMEREGCEVRVCDLGASVLEKHPELKWDRATKLDWDEEYLDKVLSIKVCENLTDAITHINQHGSKHTEGIISEDQKSIESFKDQVDASCLVVNASTRFNDGGELCLGAELGISTSKLHAYGPMGAKEMTSYRYVVTGDGHVRS
ncbi:MAG: glutamate-5-semialdehyde dehydrogenase [Oligoflexales bacterium]|nr:glutamate-5-semialdehyde dehydrogenase [Oligoflexales bacterium]